MTRTIPNPNPKKPVTPRRRPSRLPTVIAAVLLTSVAVAAYIVIKNQPSTAAAPPSSTSTAPETPARVAETSAPAATPVAAPAPPAGPASKADLEQALSDYFAATPEKRATWSFNPRMDQYLAGDEAGTRALVWKALCASEHETLAKDLSAMVVHAGSATSPFAMHTVGTRPAAGWGLVIAMHGGGGAPKAVNDEQWDEMKIYYSDQPQKPGYIYCALRAPNDTWNGFYDLYVYPLIAKLIRQFVICGDVDPQRVYLIGYSHGGYGAFAIGPKMPDRFAFIHASAAAPSGNQSSPKTLRTTPFTYWVGGADNAYSRIDLCTNFDKAIKALRGDRTDIYPATFKLFPGVQHSYLPDRGYLVEMLDAIRIPAPHEVSWEETDNVLTSLYWISDDKPDSGREVDATCKDNTVTVTCKDTHGVSIWLDSRLVDLSKPVTLTCGTDKRTFTPAPLVKNLCDSMVSRGDPDLAFSVRVRLDQDQAPAAGAAPSPAH